MSNLFGSKSLINTGVDSTANTPQVNEAMNTMASDELPEITEAGYFTVHAGYVTAGNKKVHGISCDKGFFYPESMGEEVMAELKSLADRGFAYAAIDSAD